MSQRRFVVIEPSIKSEGGHYLQYALHVLRAAADEGFQPVLACHKDFAGREVAGIEVHPAFSFGFWHRFETSHRQSRLAKYAGYPARIKNGLMVRFDSRWYYSKGYLALARFFGPLWAKRWLRRSIKLVALLPYLPFWLMRATFRKAYGFVTPHLEPKGDDALQFSTENAIHTMAAELAALGKNLQLHEGDHLLLATVSGAELHSVLDCLDHAPELKAATWHLVFRRNLRSHPMAQFGGFESELVQNGLDKWSQKNPNVQLYTDTDALTAEHNMLANKRVFSTLPIPHVKSRSTPFPGAPAVITYLGDARTEKGYQHLAEVVESVKVALLDSRKARFRLQSNFNTAAGDADCIISRKELSLNHVDQVELITDAQSEEQYWHSFESSHLVLIPYDVNNYSERSSGIFAEAVGMEVPVVVPAGTWMSRQLCLDNYERLAKAFPAGDLTSLQPIPDGLELSLYNPIERRWFFQPARPKVAFSVQNRSGRFVIVKVPLIDTWFARLTITQRDAAGAAQAQKELLLEVADPFTTTDAFFELDLQPETVSIQIQANNCGLSNLGEVHAAFFPVKPTLDAPAGEIYFHWRELPNLVEQIVEQHERYRSGMSRYSVQWKVVHSGPGFMSALKGINA
jgi:hypothetical protein